MRYHVLGVGSIGSLLSHHLRRVLPSSHSVTLLHKNTHYAKNALQKDTICVERSGVMSRSSGFLSETSDGYIVKGSHSSNVKEAEEDIESLFVTTKAYSTVPAVRSLASRLSPNSTIVLLQNGLGIYEELCKEVFPDTEKRPHFILATNTHGVYAKNRQHVVHNGLGSITFGIMPNGERDYEAGFYNTALSRDERRLRLADIGEPGGPLFQKYRSLRNTVAAMLLLESLNPTWKPMTQVQTALHRKVVVNSVINPLTAVMNCRNGDIFNSRASLSMMKRVCIEASLAFAHQMYEGLSLEYGEDSERMEELLMEKLPVDLRVESLEAECLRIANSTRDNMSSMLSDIRQGRPTEIQYLNGYLLKLGRSYGLKMPMTLTLQQLVEMRSKIPLDQIF